MPEIGQKIELLKKIALQFEKAHITWALGGSMMLYFKGIVPVFQDIDLMVADADAQTAQSILCSMGQMQPQNPNPKFRSKAFMEFVIDSVDVDVIAGFAIVSGDSVVDCSLQKEQIAERMPLGEACIPLQSPALWCRYYRLMDRNEKAQMIEQALSDSDACT